MKVSSEFSVAIVTGGASEIGFAPVRILLILGRLNEY